MLVSYQFQRRNSVQCWINWPTDAARWAYWWRLAISIRSTCFGSSCRWRLMLRVTGFTYTRETLIDVRLSDDSRFSFVHRTTLQGKTSHKFIDMNENPIMHIYYTNRTVLGFMCLFNELFYAALYLLYFTPGPLCKSITFYDNENS